MKLVDHCSGVRRFLRGGTAALFRRKTECSGEAMAIIPGDPHPAGRTKSFRYEEEGNADVPSAPRRPQVDTP